MSIEFSLYWVVMQRNLPSGDASSTLPVKGVSSRKPRHRRACSALAAGVLVAIGALATSAPAQTGSPSEAELAARLRRAEMLAGLTPVSGPGLIVTLRHSPKKAPGGVDPANLRLHERDITAILTALRAGGAEAISIGCPGAEAERLVLQAGIARGKTGFLVNGRELKPPLQISVIGDAPTLKGELYREQGPVKAAGLDILQMIEVRESGSLELPPIRSEPVFRFAKGTGTPPPVAARPPAATPRPTPGTSSIAAAAPRAAGPGALAAPTASPTRADSRSKPPTVAAGLPASQPANSGTSVSRPSTLPVTGAGSTIVVTRESPPANGRANSSALPVGGRPSGLPNAIGLRMASAASPGTRELRPATGRSTATPGVPSAGTPGRPATLPVTIGSRLANAVASGARAAQPTTGRPAGTESLAPTGNPSAPGLLSQPGGSGQGAPSVKERTPGTGRVASTTPTIGARLGTPPLVASATGAGTGAAEPRASQPQGGRIASSPTLSGDRPRTPTLMAAVPRGVGTPDLRNRLPETGRPAAAQPPTPVVTVREVPRAPTRTPVVDTSPIRPRLPVGDRVATAVPPVIPSAPGTLPNPVASALPRTTIGERSPTDVAPPVRLEPSSPTAIVSKLPGAPEQAVVQAVLTGINGPVFGGRGLGRYHLPGCRFGERIDPAQRISFLSAEIAQRDGRESCPICCTKGR